jgi:hypothetical protein
VSVFARAAATPERLVGGVKAAVRSIDPNLFVEDLRTLETDEAHFSAPHDSTR